MKINHLFFWGICFILFLPIVIFPPTFQPSDWTRTILFRTILTILISFLFFKYFNKKEAFISIPKMKILTYAPFLALSGFSISLILSTIFSEDIRFSIFGSPARAGGLLNFLFFFVFAIFLALFIKEKDWEKLFKINFLAGFFASLLAIVQYFNLIKQVFISSEGGHTPSFLGSSTFLAIYMLFLSFLSLFFLIKEIDKKKKLFYAGLLLLFLFTILITGARAVYLGALIGFFYFFLFFPIKSSSVKTNKKLRLAKIMVVALSILTVLIVVYVNISPKLPSFIENNARLSYFAHNRLSIKIVLKDLLETRLSAWKIAVQTIKEKPIFGWGPENFQIGFEKNYDPTLPQMRQLWWNRAHNIILDTAATSGIISSLFYLIFWITLFWRLQILKREEDNRFRYLAHWLQAMFMGYLIVLLFNFDSFATYLISFFFIGYSFYLLSEKEDKIIILPPPKNILQKKFIVIPFLIILVCFVWFWNIKPLYINEKIVYADNLAGIKKCQKALNIINKSWKNAGILKSYAGLRYSTFLKDCAPQNPEKEIEYAAKGVEALKTSSILQPKFTRTWLFMGGFTNVLAAREKDSENKNRLILEARGYLNKALELSPKRPEIMIEMEKNYLIEQNYKEMKNTGENCIKIDPKRGECYWYLGISEIFLGEQANGKKHIEDSQNKDNIPFSNAYVQLGVAYLSQKNYVDATDAYYLAAFYDSKNASYHAVLAFLYREIGKYPEASAEALKVFELQPDNKETIDFIQEFLRLTPNDPKMHQSLAYIYKQTGQEDKAKQELLIIKSIYLQLITTYPNRPEYHYNLANIYKELQDYEKAYKEALLTEKIDLRYQTSVANLIQSLPEGYWKKYQDWSNNR